MRVEMNSSKFDKAGSLWTANCTVYAFVQIDEEASGILIVDVSRETAIRSLYIPSGCKADRVAEWSPKTPAYGNSYALLKWELRQ